MNRNSIYHLHSMVWCKYKAWLLVEHRRSVPYQMKDPLSPAAGGAGSRAPGRQGQPRTFYLDFVFPGGWLDWYCWAGGNSPYQVPPPPPPLPRMNHEDTPADM